MTINYFSIFSLKNAVILETLMDLQKLLVKYSKKQWWILPIRQNFINLNKIQAYVRLKRTNMSVFRMGMLYIFGIYVLILSAIFVALEHRQ